MAKLTREGFERSAQIVKRNSTKHCDVTTQPIQAYFKSLYEVYIEQSSHR